MAEFKTFSLIFTDHSPRSSKAFLDVCLLSCNFSALTTKRSLTDDLGEVK